jgi:hypothetical protein
VAVVLEEATWAAHQEAHHVRVDDWIAPHLDRGRRGAPHPVHDFLFTYYSHRPAQLRRWHPGAGITLAGQALHRDWPGYRTTAEGVCLEQPNPERLATVSHWIELLRATATRRAQFGCFGLHEWAMVYRTAEIRHASWPMRLPEAEIAQIVEAAPMRCTHYDAFRFFTPPARPLNQTQLSRAAMSEHEQGGCLHTNMDLYKVAYKLTPFVPSELVADCFELAREIRELDMRASPYDLSALGYAAVAIETPAGRTEYVAAQQRFADSAALLRGRLLGVLEPLVEQVQPTCQ